MGLGIFEQLPHSLPFCQIAKMKTPPSRKTSQAKKGSATRVVRRRAVEVEGDDDTIVRKMVQVSLLQSVR